MRLSCALVSSFLFVSAVLAGYDPEKQQRVENSINSTTVWPTKELAGIVWTAYSEEIIETAVGTFTVPSVENGNAIFTIMMGISDSVCDSITIVAGILVWANPDEVTYKGFAQWEPDGKVLSPLTISAGNKIRASIVLQSTTRGFITLTNLDQPPSRHNPWSAEVGGTPPDSHCKQEVQWVIEPPVTDNTPIPDFDSVFITKMEVKVFEATKPEVPRRPNIVVRNIEHPQVETCVMVYRDHVIIVYVPPPE